MALPIAALARVAQSLPSALSMGGGRPSMSIKVDTTELERKLRNAQKQIPFATSKALNDTADAVAKRLTGQMDRFLDRPTPFTKRAFLTASGRFKGKRANRRDLEAIIMADKAQNEYLRLNVFGGIRTPKRRAIMVPTGKVPVNRYGNVPRAVQRQMAGQTGKYFKGNADNNLDPGIYRRTRTGIEMVATYEPSANYRKIYPVKELGAAAVRYWWRIKAQQAIKFALRTAR